MTAHVCEQDQECKGCGEWICEDCAAEVDHDGETYMGEVLSSSTRVTCGPCLARYLAQNRGVSA